MASFSYTIPLLVLSSCNSLLKESHPFDPEFLEIRPFHLPVSSTLVVL